MTTYRLASAAMMIALAQTAACEPTNHQHVRAKFAESFKCNPDAVTIVEIKDTPDYTLIKAKGCNESKLYICERTHEAVAGRDRGGARGNMRDTTACHEQDGASP